MNPSLHVLQEHVVANCFSDSDLVHHFNANLRIYAQQCDSLSLAESNQEIKQEKSKFSLM